MRANNNNCALSCFKLIFLFVLISSVASSWLPKKVPSPKLHPSKCIDLSSAKVGIVNGEADLDYMWVCNPDNILDSSSVDAINQELHSLSQIKQEECQRGIQVC